MCIVIMDLKELYVRLSDNCDMYMYGMCWNVDMSILKGLCLNEVCI